MTTPYPFQERGIRRISKFRGRVLLADEMGLGKSLQSLVWARDNGAFPAIIVCPASLKYNWEHEVNIHINMEAQVLEGKTPPRRRGFLRRQQIVIINYDILGAWLPYLLDMDPELVIGDEIHYCKNGRAQRTKNMRQLCKRIPNVIAISGTPLTNRPAELWTILNMVRPDLYPSFLPFACRHCKPRRTPWGWEYKGAERLDELHTNLKNTMMIRRRKSQVLKDLPPMSENVVLLPIKNRREYDSALHNFLGWLATKSKVKAQRAAAAERLVKVGYLKRLAAELKLDSVCEWVDSFLESSSEKLVLFGIHKQFLSTLRQRYKSQSVLIDGSVTGKDRHRKVRLFNNKKRVRILFGNMQAAGVGLNLTASRTVALAELGWTPGEHNQAKDRVHRIGQTRAATCYYLIAKGTIEEDLYKLTKKKQETLDEVLDGSVTASVMDILEQLELKLKRKGKHHEV